MAPHRPVLGKETAILRQVVGNPYVRFRFTDHARKEMEADQIIEADVRHVLGRYGVSWVEWKKDEIWHVEGLDVDGRSISDRNHCYCRYRGGKNHHGYGTRTSAMMMP